MLHVTVCGKGLSHSPCYTSLYVDMSESSCHTSLYVEEDCKTEERAMSAVVCARACCACTIHSRASSVASHEITVITMAGGPIAQ